MTFLLKQAVTVWAAITATQSLRSDTTSEINTILAVSETPGLVGICTAVIVAGSATSGFT